MATKYRVLAGMDYPPDKRAEPGDIVSDLPAKSVGWLLEQGYIEPVEAGDKT
ncbi:MAG TPA: hypothetical protein VLH56_14010 [Dissulfurispiraceae bacterium]|nr:hypothetical protein [Dissulfurispiraceae bacterium]